MPDDYRGDMTGEKSANGDHTKGHQHHHHIDHVCTHDHDDGHHHHDHHHHATEEDNHGLLNLAFSKAGVEPDHWLQRHRSKIALAAAGGLAAFEYGVLGGTSTEYGTIGGATTLYGQFAMAAAAGWLAHDTSEDLMESVGKLKETHRINSGVIGMSVGAAHTSAELLMSMFAEAGNYSAMAVASTMGSHVSHIPFMVGIAATIGAISVDRFSAWKMNSLSIAAVTGAFGYQIATGEFNPYLSAGMVGAGLGHIWWRMKAGQTCEVHCHSCGQVHDHGDEKDYVSVSYLKDIAEKIKVPKDSKALDRLVDSVKNIGGKISTMSPPKPKEIYTKLKNFGSGVVHPNVIKLGASVAALGLSAHVLGNNVSKMAETTGVSTTAMGASVAALAFALPELILTAKAAWKKDGEMAWGAITGCTIATVGIVGGYQGLNDFTIPPSLSLAIEEGRFQMTAFVASAGAIIAATHPWTAKQFAKVDNWFANRFKNRVQSVSNWLRNDGTKISKVAVAAPMLVGALYFYSANTLPICHSHGTWVHCFNPVAGPLLPADEAREALKNAVPEQSGPDF